MTAIPLYNGISFDELIPLSQSITRSIQDALQILCPNSSLFPFLLFLVGFPFAIVPPIYTRYLQLKIHIY